MKDVPGTSPLTEAQQQEMFARYGFRYVAVADGYRYPVKAKRTLAGSVKTRKATR